MRTDEKHPSHGMRGGSPKKVEEKKKKNANGTIPAFDQGLEGISGSRQPQKKVPTRKSDGPVGERKKGRQVRAWSKKLAQKERRATTRRRKKSWESGGQNSLKPKRDFDEGKIWLKKKKEGGRDENGYQPRVFQQRQDRGNGVTVGGQSSKEARRWGTRHRGSRSETMVGQGTI